MAQQFDHLTAITAELLHLSDDLRIREVQSERWVHYPRAKAALAAMGRLAVRRDNQDENRPTIRMRIRRRGDSEGRA